MRKRPVFDRLRSYKCRIFRPGSEYFNLYSKQQEPNELNQFQIEQELSRIKEFIKETTMLNDKKQIEKSFSIIRKTIHQLYV